MTLQEETENLSTYVNMPKLENDITTLTLEANDLNAQMAPLRKRLKDATCKLEAARSLMYKIDQRALNRLDTRMVNAIAHHEAKRDQLARRT